MSVKTLSDSLSSSTSELLASKRACGSANHAGAAGGRVRFGKVAIQEHAVTVGDNPACSGGAPIR